MKMRRKVFLFAALVFSSLLLTPAVAFAQQQVVWTHAAAACTIDEDSSSKHEFLGGRMRLKGTNTGAIVARCNITNPLDSGGNPGSQWNYLEVAYADPDGPTLASQVTAILYRVHNIGGGVDEIVKFDSNQFAINNNQVPQGVLINHSFNFTEYAYYVEIKLKRDSSAATPSISIVRLTYNLF